MGMRGSERRFVKENLRLGRNGHPASPDEMPRRLTRTDRNKTNSRTTDETPRHDNKKDISFAEAKYVQAPKHSLVNG